MGGKQKYIIIIHGLHKTLYAIKHVDYIRRLLQLKNLSCFQYRQEMTNLIQFYIIDLNESLRHSNVLRALSCILHINKKFASHGMTLLGIVVASVKSELTVSPCSIWFLEIEQGRLRVLLVD